MPIPSEMNLRADPDDSCKSAMAQDLTAHSKQPGTDEARDQPIPLPLKPEPPKD